MKNKILKSLTALTAALMLLGGFSVTAYAQSSEPAEETSAIEEAPEPSAPLTPEGNATIVDDIYGENKQLITVTTKAGNYFYILIDRAADGENTVHFLNKVDETDLMALIEDGKTAEPETTVMTCTCTEKCEAGNVNETCPVCKNNRTACNGKKAEPEAEPQPEQAKDTGKTKSMLLLFLVTVLAGGGAFYYFKFLKPKNTKTAAPEFADFDFEDEDEEPEAEPEEEPDTEETDSMDGDTTELPADDTEDKTGDTL